MTATNRRYRRLATVAAILAGGLLLSGCHYYYGSHGYRSYGYQGHYSYGHPGYHGYRGHGGHGRGGHGGYYRYYY